MAITFRQRAAYHLCWWPRYLPDGRLLGLDLSGPGLRHRTLVEDVAKLVMRCWRGPARDLDPEVLLQQVVLSLIERNRCPGAYDPRRGAVSTYVTLVTRGVICNMLESKAAHARHEAQSDPEREAEEPAPLRPAVGHVEDTWAWEEELAALEPPVPLWRHALDERERLGQLDLAGRVAAPPTESVAAAPRAPAVRRPVVVDPRQCSLF